MRFSAETSISAINTVAGEKYEFYSAGTETKPQINQDAVRLIKQLYGIDMEKTQYSKTYDKIPEPDLAILIFKKRI